LMGDFSKARGCYRKTLEVAPTFLEANTHLGRLLLADGRIDEAQRYFNAQVESGQISAEALRGLAIIHIDRSENSRAEEYLREILTSDPKDTDAMLKLARVYHKMGRQEQANDILKQATATGVDDPAICKELAQTCFLMERYREASQIYEQLLGKERTSELINDLGNCYFKLENWEEAASQYRRALECAPVVPVVYRNLGLAEARRQRRAEAIEALEKYMELEPDQCGLDAVLGDLHCGLRNYDQALPYYEKSLQSNPSDPAALFRLSECYLLMGHTDSAITGYQKILQMTPEFEPARQRMNQLSQTAGRV